MNAPQRRDRVLALRHLPRPLPSLAPRQRADLLPEEHRYQLHVPRPRGEVQRVLALVRDRLGVRAEVDELAREIVVSSYAREVQRVDAVGRLEVELRAGGDEELRGVHLRRAGRGGRGGGRGRRGRAATGRDRDASERGARERARRSASDDGPVPRARRDAAACACARPARSRPAPRRQPC
eukprot:31405-Pelagococcus_subviridis.AAC.9